MTSPSGIDTGVAQWLAQGPGPTTDGQVENIVSVGAGRNTVIGATGERGHRGGAKECDAPPPEPLAGRRDANQKGGQDRRFERQAEVGEGDVWLVDPERETPLGGNGACLGKKLKER